MTRRLLLLGLLPIVWAPTLLAVVLVAPHLPVWAWVFAVVFWFALWRRRHTGYADGVGVEDGPRFSPTRGGGF